MKQLVIAALLSAVISGHSHAAVRHRTISDTATLSHDVPVDVNQDGSPDYRLYIDTLPTGDLYCKVVSIGMHQVLGISTHGYVDALIAGAAVAGNWTSSGVLGTIFDGGEFTGKGKRYLGLMMNLNGAYHAGWLCVSLDADRSKLAVIEAAYNDVPDAAIMAGQKFTTPSGRVPKASRFSVLQHGKTLLLSAPYDGASCRYSLYRISGGVATSGSMTTAEKVLSLHHLDNGLYFLALETPSGVETQRIYLTD